jgi:uncharacterized membrane protein SirB2
MLCTMFYTYWACENEKLCPPLPKLPTISNTWDNPPGNFLSRYVVSHVALAMGFAQYAIWAPLAATKKCWKVLRGLAVLSVALFSVVGAVCDDDTDPQCMGFNTLHVACAVTFLVLYNLNMAEVSCKKKKSKKRCCPRGPTVDTCLLVITSLSLLAKARFVPQIAELFGDETPIAVVEWTDVILIVVWTVSMMWFFRRGYAVQLRHDDPPASSMSADDTILVKVSARTLTAVVLIMFFGTLAICTGFAFKQGRVPKGSWPFISDTFVHKPGNWISRWSLVLGGTFSQMLQVTLYFLDGKTSLGDKAICALSIFAILGLAIVGVCNESENIVLHLTGASIFFVGYDLFMVLRTMRSLLCSSGSGSNAASPWGQRGQMLLAIVSTVCTVVRCLPVDTVSSMLHVDRPREILLPVLEWLDAIAIVGYMSVAVLSYGHDATARVGVAVVEISEAGEGDDGCPQTSIQVDGANARYELL